MDKKKARLASAALLVIAVAAALSYCVILAITRYGASNVQAFAGVMSFVAVVIAAAATVIYVLKTSEIAQAALESSQQQARVANLMEQDLRVRIAPYLRYEPAAGDSSKPEGYVRNSGSGVAVGLRAMFRLTVSGREGKLEVPELLEPRRDHVERVRFSRETREGQYVIEFSCTDSLSFNDYWFQWNESGNLTGHKITPRPRS